MARPQQSTIVDQDAQDEGQRVDLAVVIPALHEAQNLARLLPDLRAVLDALAISYQIIIVDRRPDAETRQLADSYQARLLDQQDRGYGSALALAFRAARARYILTMDADLSHPPLYIHDLWQQRHEADVIIASRYVPGGQYDMPLLRATLSRILNLFFSRGLDLKVRDMSSGFRLYNARALQ